MMGASCCTKILWICAVPGELADWPELNVPNCVFSFVYIDMVIKSKRLLQVNKFLAIAQLITLKRY